MGSGTLSAYTETEHRLRDLNGVLELALMLACDRIREHEGGEELPWMDRLLGEAQQRLREAGRFPGRLSLFGEGELALFAAAVPEGSPLGHEIEFDFARRGAVRA